MTLISVRTCGQNGVDRLIECNNRPSYPRWLEDIHWVSGIGKAKDVIGRRDNYSD